MLTEPCNINPIDVFGRLYSQPYSFLLDSSGLSRYSFAGADPFVVIKAQNSKVAIAQGSTCRIVTDDIFSVLAYMLNEYKMQCIVSPACGNHRQASRAYRRSAQALQTPVIPFHGGAVGYFGYELKNQIEQFSEKRSAEPAIPGCILGLYDTVFAYDHRANKGYVLASGLPEKNGRTRKLLARQRLNHFFDVINQPQIVRNRTAGTRRETNKKGLRQTSGDIAIKSNFTKQGYINAVKHVQRYIASGDIYQANLSQRFTIECHEDPLLFYSRLRSINPAQFGAFLNYGEFQVISNSPERLLKLNNDVAETSPIKGTMARGKNPKEDKMLIQELKKSHKELAEHIMIVDLERNDLGKICEYDSIKAQVLQKVYTYPTLHHMASTIKGKIKSGIGPVDCVKALFPGGSVTGAPKIRAMEIIDELEPAPRGIYTGAIGYMDFCGNVDISMAIRTAVLKENSLYLDVGGGIVADSDPEKEYEETILKANAFFRAIKGG